jgi:hypothetical protein
MENSETRAARGEALALLLEANANGDMSFMRKLLTLVNSLMPEEQSQIQPHEWDTAAGILPTVPAVQAPADNNGYCFISAENESASLIVLKHQIYGRQIWQRSYLSEPDVCTVTGQELLKDWLAYWPPVDARNSGEVIGEAGIRRLLKCS